MNAILVCFPFLVVSVSILGFLFGVPITRWHLVVSIFAFLPVLYFVPPRQDRARIVVTFLITLVASVLLAMLPVMYTLTDGANCHRPACFLLANGWNPIAHPEQSEVSAMLNSFCDTRTYRLFSAHIAFVPKAAWIYGAVFYRFFGFVEVADCLHIYLLISATLVTLSWFRRFTQFTLWERIGLTAATVLSPFVLDGLFGGCVDASMCILILMGLFQFDAYRRERRWTDLAWGVIALSLASAIKYTGLPIAILAPLFYLLFTKGRRTLAIAFPAVVILIFALNATPCLTSWVNHGGPFYPAHSFDKREIVKDNMTPDFDMKNDDAKAMGYVGRFCYAFISKELTCAYYKHKLRQDNFNPQLMLFHEIDGFGSFYRLLFVLSLILFFFLKDRGVKIMMLILFASIFAVPGKYMGYARYMAPSYWFPVMAIIGLMMQVQWRAVRCALLVMVASLAIMQAIEPMKKIPYMWLMSVQNLQTILKLEHEVSPKVATGNFYSAVALRSDTNAHVDIVPMVQVKDAGLPYAYGPCNQRFVYLTADPIADFRAFSMTPVDSDSSIMNKTFFVERTKGIEMYFLKDFLPTELFLLPRRFCQTMAYRGRQLARVWSK